MHSHVLPGIDDGARNIDESRALLERFADLGYSKIVTTPHIMSDIYRNTPETIERALSELNRNFETPIAVEAAAEYYLDEELIKKVNSGERLLTISGRYLLFEMNFVTEPLQLKEFIFLAQTKGYQLILAHPERYLFIQQDMQKAEDLIDRGVLFQLNINSFTGHYSREAKKTAQQLVDRKWVHWLSSDAHRVEHLDLMKDVYRLKYFQKALTLPLLNHTLE